MASGDRMAELLARDALPTNTVNATLDTINDGSTPVGVIPVLDYDGSAQNESADWEFIVPPNYDGGGFTLQNLKYAMDGVDGSAVQMELRIQKIVANDNLGSNNLGGQTATDITDTPNGTADRVDVAPNGSVSHVNAGSPSAGDKLRVRLTRDYDHTVNADDLQYLESELVET